MIHLGAWVEGAQGGSHAAPGTDRRGEPEAGGGKVCSGADDGEEEEDQGERTGNPASLFSL